MQDAHETGENDKFYTGIAQHFYELLFNFRLQTRAKSARRQVRICDTKLPRHIKDRCIQHIRNHNPRFRGEIARPDALEDRAAVTSLPRSENSNGELFHLNGFVFNSCLYKFARSIRKLNTLSQMG